MIEQTERYGGLPFKWGGKTYLLAPIGLGPLERALQKMTEGRDGKLSPDEIVLEMHKVIFRSLQRNYPDLTEDFIRDEILDLTNVGELYQLACEASGLKLLQGKARAGNLVAA